MGGRIVSVFIAITTIVCIGAFLWGEKDAAHAEDSLLMRGQLWWENKHHTTTTTTSSVTEPAPTTSQSQNNVVEGGGDNAIEEETEEGKSQDGGDTTSITTSTRSKEKEPYVVETNDNDDEQQELVQKMQIQLQPRILLWEQNYTALSRHQFLHLHHMKTGGTSMDKLISCGRTRLREIVQHSNTQKQQMLNYSNIHECGESHYKQCVDGSDRHCQNSVQTAAIMSYCAPLKDLYNPFTWEFQNNDDNGDNDDHQNHSLHAAVTVFRHPVHRVWSMFRFQTKSCYKCKTLKEIYDMIDAGDHDEFFRSDGCRLQLLNHQTRNLMSRKDVNLPTTDEHVQEAIENMKNVFTMIGITEDMPNTAKMAGRVFPWLAETIDDVEDDLGLPYDDYDYRRNRRQLENGLDRTCSLSHANSSPKNNQCGGDHGGKKSSHWNLPDEPDEETARLILEHNQLDMKIYEAAVAQFELQKRALGIE